MPIARRVDAEYVLMTKVHYMCETQEIGVRKLHPDFPVEPILRAVGGARPKMLLKRGENGTYDISRRSLEEIRHRFTVADDIAGQLVTYFKRKKRKFPKWTDEKHYERIRLALINKATEGKWRFTDAEQAGLCAVCASVAHHDDSSSCNRPMLYCLRAIGAGRPHPYSRGCAQLSRADASSPVGVSMYVMSRFENGEAVRTDSLVKVFQGLGLAVSARAVNRTGFTVPPLGEAQHDLAGGPVPNSKLSAS